jgi:hypothetical protein
VWADKKMTARSREEHYEELHGRALAEIGLLRDSLGAQEQSTLLRFSEVDQDRSAQLEIEELNQQSFDNLRHELKQSHNCLNEEVGTLKSFVGQSLNSLGNSFHELRRQTEQERMTAQKKSQLHAQIESNVQKTLTATLEGQINRELANVKLDVRQSLTEMERSSVLQQNVMQQVEKRLYDQQQQMFEIEKTQAKLSVLFPEDEVLGAGGGGAHRISVMDFALKGVVERLSNLESDVAARDERFMGIFKSERDKLEEQREEIAAELRKQVEEARASLNGILEQTRLEINELAFNFETSSRADADKRNREALRVASRALAKAGEAEAYAKSKADVLETKVGRVRIDFDRMVGDTTAACEALADGLAGVRADVRGVGNEVRMGLLPPEPPKQLPPYQPFYGMGTR